MAVSAAKAHPPNSFNPNVGKNWTMDTDGARFNPFPDKSGDNVPTIYAATSYEAAALESVFHAVPHVQTPEIIRSQVETWEYLICGRFAISRLCASRTRSCANSKCQAVPNHFGKTSLSTHLAHSTQRPALGRNYFTTMSRAWMALHGGQDLPALGKRMCSSEIAVARLTLKSSARRQR